MTFSTFEYTYNAQTTTPPAGGQLRFNDADPALATVVYFSDHDAPGVDVTNLLPFFGAGDALIVQDKDDATRMARYATGDPIMQTGYMELPITYESGSGTLPAGQRVLAIMGTFTQSLPPGADPGEFLGVNTTGDPEWMPLSGGGGTPVPIPGYAGCAWPIDPACLTAEWDALAEDVKTRSIGMASTTLHRLTGYRVGGCPITVRPCKAGCNTYGMLSYWSVGPAFFPHIAPGGMWVNSCPCVTDCSCGPLCEVTLPAPVGEVHEVVVDGTIQDPSTYRVDGNRLVWVGDGDCPWPTCQNLSLPDTEEGTFSVTYLNSYPVDGWGAYAAGVLAMEYAKACTGSKTCRLPGNVTAVTRQGVSFDLVAGSFPGGFTSIREVDAFISTWNPTPIRQQSQVWSPDLHQPRVIR